MERQTQVLGQSGHFLQALERASAVAAVDRPVVLVGERGTGKAVVAERLHRLSDRWNKPLVTANGAAVIDLFGDQGRAGRAGDGVVQRAAGGTLVLEDVGALSPVAQLRLLRALERGEVGERHPRPIDVRIVATTDAHLPALVAAGSFRADLLERLAFAVITLPPLRERGGDALLLAHHHGRRMAVELGRDTWRGFGEEAVAQLTAHRWPGNLRELQITIERSVAAWSRPDEPVDDLILDPFRCPWQPVVETPPGPAGIEAVEMSLPVTNLRAATIEFERRVVAEALERCRHNGRAAAKALGLTYDQFRHTARKHDLI